jgi:OmpA-OmpF porin, OOP family
MNKVSIVGWLICCIIFSIGCATKGYVRKQTMPLQDKVNELDQRTAENTKQINDVDTRAQQGIQALTASNGQVDKKATDAGTLAQQAQQLATTADTKASSLGNVVANLNNYHVVAETSVEFGFGDARLSADAKKALDDFSGQLSSAQSSMIFVQGRTDDIGGEEYNYGLSQRRAEEVVRYLVAKYDVPAYKVRTIGLGKEKPVAPNNTSDGRKQNRRADVQIVSNGEQPPSQGSTPGQAASAGGEVGRVIPSNR